MYTTTPYRRLLAAALAITLALGAAPLPVVAQDAPPLGLSGEITAFAPLDPEVAEQSVPLGTELFALDLPDTLEVTVAEAVEAAEPATPTQLEEPAAAQVPVAWESAPAYDGDTAGVYRFTPVAEGYAIGVEPPQITVTVGGRAVTAFAALAEEIRWQDGMVPTLSETVEGTVEGAQAEIPVTWESDTWDPEAPVSGLHVLLARPEEGYTVTEGVEVPRITFMRQSLGRMAGTGTESHPLQITTADQLAEIAALVNEGRLESTVFGQGSTATVYLKLVNDLDLSKYGKSYNSGKSWTPIGTQADSFQGSFDGGGNTIRGLIINDNNLIYAGLFGYVNTGTVQDLGLVDVAVSGSSYVGGVVGCLHSGTVERCYTTGNVSGNGDIGGVVGRAMAGTVADCYSTAHISGWNRVGGIAGQTDGALQNCYATGAVNGTGLYIGGVVGYVNSSIQDCAALNPTVNGGSDTGRVVGANAGTLTNNAAFIGMTVNGSTVIGTVTNQNGQSVSTPYLLTDPTIGNRFDGAVWTTEPGKLPGLFGQTVDMPGYLLVDIPSPFIGFGTSNDPYQITTPDQLADLARLVNAGNTRYKSAHYKLMNDLDLSGFGASYNGGKGWTPIGNSIKSFQGSFDGGGNTIRGLYINDNILEYAGLFGYVDTGTVHDLGLVDVNIMGRQTVGGVVGRLSSGTVERCYTTGSVSGNNYSVGGIVGVTVGTITDCFSTAQVSGIVSVGGIAGTYYGALQNCYATGAVSGTGQYAGGVAGEVSGSGSIQDCAALNPTVSGSSDTGRIVGSNAGTLTNNAAFTGMTVNGSTVSGGTDTNQNGQDIPASGIFDDATIGNRFDGAAWTTEPGKLPGLFGQPVELPFHLLVDSGSPFPGSGASTDPYQITTPDHLAALARLVNAGDTQYAGAHYKLMNDLDLSGFGASYNGGTGWTPIGTSANPFQGSFDGDGNTIRGLYIHDSGRDESGLFGLVDDGTVRDLGVVDVHISAGHRIGGIVGNLTNDGTVERCYVTGQVSGTEDIGGVAGAVSESTIHNCYSMAQVSGTNNAGGIAGQATNSRLQYCYATGQVSGSGSIGGVAGYIHAGSTVEHCASLNPGISGTNNVGRVTGNMENGTLANNRAFTGMTGGGSGKTAGGKDGADMTAAQASAPSFWTGDMGWDAAVWELEPGKLPLLRGISGQNGDPGLYLTGLPGESDALSISPSVVTLKPGESLTFTVTGWEEWTMGEITFAATVGTVTTGGNGTATLQIPASAESGIYTLTATNPNSGKQVSAAVTIVTKPGTPTNARATAGDGQATVSFTPPSDNGGRDITQYTVRSNTGGHMAIGTSSPITVTGLANGTAYTFTVTATNAIGEGPASAPSNQVTPQANIQPVPVTGVSLNKSATTLLVNGSEPLYATVTPANATNQNITWSSSNPAVATVNGNGVVTGVSAGTAAITVTTVDGNHTATCSVTVSATAVPVTGVGLNKSTTTLSIGGIETLSATITPAGATNQNVTWRSSNPSVATVDPAGRVTGVSVGSATITITTADGGFTATCTVTVDANAVAVTGVSLHPGSMTLKVRETGALTASVHPANATNQAVTWRSGNPAVATVDGSGKVTGVRAGITSIIVTTVDGSYAAVCRVTVTADSTGNGDGDGSGGNGGGTSGGGSVGSRGSSSGGSSGRGSGGSNTAKTTIPASAFAWDGDRTLTINHDHITPLGLTKVLWDGKETTAYRVYQGSVVIRFDADFIENQSPGTHTVRVEFLNHTGETTITVGGTEPGSTGATGNGDTHNPSTGGDDFHNPQTGDFGPSPWVWLAVLLPAAAVVLYTALQLPRRRSER